MELQTTETTAGKGLLGIDEDLQEFELKAKYVFEGEGALSSALSTLLMLAPKNWLRARLKVVTREFL